ncbi:glycosyltransferase family 4 protein [Luteipulveratus flavus]|uniref:Glycosyltransferase family 4 protein n=1 Tax=Luteipulveratus flavus TaxID=3031728 RepID=A0ABT6CC63_9MICO|nr:glycosyltransferase family 4 protein [Luteipulveratus sp. YIM 133296]MDF8266494.1 glycosyltransferase family 4 protein [Luteipulveratus sp. YIM 133296]
MRVATAAYAFDYAGGIERAAYEVATRIAAGGTDMDLYAHRIDPRPEPPLTWHPVAMPVHVPFATALLFSRQATRALDYRAYDIVHNQGGCALRRQDVITAHSCHRAWWQLKLENGERTRALLNPQHHAVLRVEGANYRPGAYQHVIAVSQGVAREIEHHYGVPRSAITVVPNGVDAALFAPPDHAAQRAQERRRHGFTDDEVVLLWVGKEFRRKGLGPVVEALAQLPDHVRLLAVGGDHQEPFRALARANGVADRVVFAGHSSHVHRLFQAGDVFVLPTLYEAFALVTLEAAAAGLPLVVTRVNGTEDFVREGSNGAFVERAPGSVAAALAPLVSDRQLRRRMGEQARRDVQGYTWDAAARRTQEVYDEVHERRCRRRRSA